MKSKIRRSASLAERNPPGTSPQPRRQRVMENGHTRRGSGRLEGQRHLPWISPGEIAQVVNLKVIGAACPAGADQTSVTRRRKTQMAKAKKKQYTSRRQKAKTVHHLVSAAETYKFEAASLAVGSPTIGANHDPVDRLDAASLTSGSSELGKPELKPIKSRNLGRPSTWGLIRARGCAMPAKRRQTRTYTNARKQIDCVAARCASWGVNRNEDC